MIRNILLQQQEEQNILLNLPYINRISDHEKEDLLQTSLIKLITGPRRAGKSVMALQLLKNKKFAYINFDDDLMLKNFDEDKVMQGLNDVYAGYEYLMLDEIQNLPNWELWVSKLYRRGINLVITGSNSKLLSHEMATALTGRYIQLTVLPFSFQEMLTFNDYPIPRLENITPIEKGKINAWLQDYLVSGGFPESIRNPGITKIYLSSLFDSILLKDILKRFQIRQTQQFYDLSNYLLTNYANLFTYNQVKDHLGFNSVATVQKFIGYLEEPYLFKHLTRYDTKIKNQQKSAQKIYVIDNGFIKARSFELAPNRGRLLENMVFIELLRRDYIPELDVFYYRTRNQREIDFLIRKGHQIQQLIQVSFDISNPKTLKREIDALIEAGEELQCKNLILINWEMDKQLIINEQIVQLVSVYKWLLVK